MWKWAELTKNFIHHSDVVLLVIIIWGETSCDPEGCSLAFNENVCKVKLSQRNAKEPNKHSFDYEF